MLVQILADKVKAFIPLSNCAPYIKVKIKWLAPNIGGVVGIVSADSVRLTIRVHFKLERCETPLFISLFFSTNSQMLNALDE